MKKQISFNNESISSRHMTLICGIDEAGRGPIVGPLVIAGVLIDERKLDQLSKIGVKDSKLLTHQSRIKISHKIKELIEDYRIIEISPQEIDGAVESKVTNLNKLEAEKAAQIIKELDPDKAIMDCPSPNIRKFHAFMSELVDDSNIELVLEHKADKNHVVVGAASILAKVRREEIVEEIEKKIGRSIGTGYQSNPECQKFLEECWDKYPELFRKSWVTWKNHQSSKMQKKLDEFNVQDNVED